jgi:predicted ATPase/class 3 adenylate cyclase
MSAAGGARSTAPSETFTFLFTDIERHTELWAANAPAMSDALAGHDALISAAVNAAGGRVVKYGGDAVMAVFGDAAAAVHAATEAQLALCDTVWPGVGTLRVRMGVHTGVAFERDGDYFGTEVIRASRLCDAAHGEQIVGSNTVAALTPERSWIDLGDHELRGLAGSQRVYQLGVPGLRAQFPSLRSAQPPRDRLPKPRTSFVGRSVELTAAAQELASHRLVTVTGVGGCGKTRLAIEVARRALDDYPDGADFVDLSTVTDEAGVYPAVAGALGLHTAQGASEPVNRRVQGFLGRRRGILVVDNCEHLLDAVAELVDDLLRECEHVRVVATSREPLRVEDERIVQVGSLAFADEGVTLFRDRVGAPIGDAATIAGICERLDGIPLAIELAAARTSHLSVDDIAVRLDDRFRLLTGGRRRVQRQQTMHATLDWSHDLLTVEERVLLRRLAVFVGPFRLRAVEGTCADDAAAVTSALGALVERSMVSYDATARTYRLLETVRLYAEQKLVDAGEADEFRRRHRDWFLEQLRGIPLEECFFAGETSRQIARELDEFRAAVRWSLAHGDTVAAAELTSRLAMAAIHVDTTEVSEWATQLVPALPADSELAFHCYLAGVWNATSSQRIERGGLAGAPDPDSLRAIHRVFAQLAALADRRSDDVSVFTRAMVANTLYALSIAMGDEDRAGKALALSDRAIEMARTRPRSAWTGYAIAFAAQVAMARNDVERAASLLRWCTTDDSGLMRGVFDGLLALTLHVAGDPDAYELATRAEERANLPNLLVTAILAAALELAANERQAEARRELEAILPEASRAPTLLKSSIVIGAAGVAFHGGEDERAARWLASAAGVGGVFTQPAGWMVFSHYVPLVRDALSPEPRARARREGDSLRIDDALTEIAQWVELTR